MDLSIKEKTISLIDSLKSTCQTYGMGNDGNEYKIITQVFLYKYMNDKFGYEIKKLDERIAKAEKWEIAYSELSEDDREDLFDTMNPDVPRLNPEHLISHLWNQQAKGDFDLIFDQTMIDIADKNIDIFSTQTTQNTKIPLFEKLTQYVTDEAQRAPFARALVDKLVNFSFEETFSEHYDFFAAIFEYLIKDYNTAGGGKYAEYYTPHAIATIMARLLVGDDADLHNIECYDPSAGTGTLLMALGHQIGEDRCTIFAQDISQRSNKMLKLNLILNGLVSSLDHAIQGDTLLAPYHKSDDGTHLRQFDYVVSNPPFKMDFSDTRDDIEKKYSARFWAGVPNVPANKRESMPIYTCFIQHLINSLKANGKGAIVVPTGFLTAKTGIESKILKHIIDERIVSGAIKMPANVFANTGTNVSVVFFDMSKSNDNAILIDAEKLGEEYQDGKNKKRRLNTQEIDKIVDTFVHRKKIQNFSAVVTYDEIAQKKYSLSAGQYFSVITKYKLPLENEYYDKMAALHRELDDNVSELLQTNKALTALQSELSYSQTACTVWNDELQRNIPEGWKVISLSEFANILTESVSPFDTPEKTFLHYSIPAFDESKTPAIEKGSEISSNKYLVPNNSILVSKLNPQFKRVWLPCSYTDNSICSTEFMPFVPKESTTRGFLYLVLSSLEFNQYMIQCASCSTGSRKRMQPELCGVFKFPVPVDNSIFEKYNRLMELLVKAEYLSIMINKELSNYQNTVIPLMSNGNLCIIK